MISNTVRFWIFATLLIPSVLCSLFATIYLLVNRTLRRVLHNHVILLVLLIGLFSEVTIYPWMLYYYQYTGTWRRAQIFCSIWAYLDWSLYVTQTVIFAWATIERHILIFHEQWMNTRSRRLLFHYLLPLALVLYCLLFYVVFYFFPPCRNYFYNSDLLCMDPCITYNFAFTMWEMAAHQILPAVVIILSSVALFIGVLRQKRRLNQAITWRKHRKMAIQVLSISILYLVCLFPYAVYCILYVFKVRTRSLRDFEEYAELLAYFMPLLLPFVCILSLPEPRSKLSKIVRLTRTTTRVSRATFAIKTLTKR